MTTLGFFVGSDDGLDVISGMVGSPLGSAVGLPRNFVGSGVSIDGSCCVGVCEGCNVISD